VEQTKELRAAEKKARLSRGVPFEEFEKSWGTQKPPEEALLYYGTWPDAKSTGPVYRP
jgi:acetophenone carboxylase